MSGAPREVVDVDQVADHPPGTVSHLEAERISHDFLFNRISFFLVSAHTGALATVAAAS